jgi:hypothetical protein
MGFSTEVVSCKSRVLSTFKYEKTSRVNDRLNKAEKLTFILGSFVFHRLIKNIMIKEMGREIELYFKFVTN